MVFGFAGCADGSDDGDAINGENIEFTHGQASDTVSAEDAAGYNYYRGFKTTKTNHYSSNALITIEKPESYLRLQMENEEKFHNNWI